MFERIKLFGYALRSAISTLSNPKRWFVDWFGGGKSKSGADVNEDTAVKVTAVFACIRLLAQTIASLPLHTYQRLEDGKSKAFNHPLYHLLHDLPNPQCTSFNLRSIMMVNLLLTGHAYAEIVRNNAGNIVELWPLPSSHVAIHKNRQTGKALYVINTEDGQLRYLHAAEVLHIQWLGLENLKPFHPVVLAREAIGLSIAAEEFGSLFFESGANASGIAEYPQKLSEEGYKRFTESFDEKYTGLNKNQRVMFLEQGLKFTKLTVNPNEAQAVETRKFQVIEIARFYNVPPHLIMDLERATFSNVEHQDISFVKYSLRPYLVCWEQEMYRSLFTEPERRQYFAEFSVDGLLRGDAKSRAEALDIQMRNGVINADEWRALENMNPQPEGMGKIYYRPLNWVRKDEPEPDPPQPNNNRMNEDNLNKRQMQHRSAQSKLKLANNYKRIFEDAASRIVSREAKDIKRKAKKAFTERSQEEFGTWLQQYYEDAPAWMKRTLKPALFSYTEAVQGLAAEQVNADSGMTPELEEWMNGYLDIWAKKYTNSQRAQIESIIRKANEAGAEPLEKIETRLDEWEEKNPDKVASNETIAAAGVVSKFVYAGAGIRYLRWVNASGAPCAFCEELHDKVVGIEEAFVGKDEQLEAEGEDQSMKVRHPSFTPPVHQKCQCTIEPD